MSAERRDFFAAHAPAEVPDFFPHDDSAMPKVLSVEAAVQRDRRFAMCGDAEKNLIRDQLMNGGLDLPPSLDAIATTALDAITESREAFQVEGDRREEVRFFAWRWYYADRMIATSGPQTTLLSGPKLSFL